MIKTLKPRGRCFSFLALLSFVLLNTGLLSAQESILQSYERIFVRAALAAKPEVLRDAATDERAAEFAEALYSFALDYCLENGELLKDDPDMITLVSTAAGGAVVWGGKASANGLWELFTIFQDSLPRVEILNALGALGRDNISIIENLNQYLTGQNNYFHSGMIPDYPVLEACIAALGRLGDASSFPVLFAAMTAGYSRNITEKAAAAFEQINGDYKQYLMGVIRKNPPAEKLAAFRLGAGSVKLSDTDRGGLAEIALEAGLEFADGGGDDAAASALRYEAVNLLAKLKWTRANTLVVRNFYQVLSDYSIGAAPRERLVEAITCMGAMGNSEAAGILVLQLGYFNSQTERSGGYDADIIIALIEALGAIGDKIAFDHLLYVGYLAYPEHIQAAAREALNRLKW